MKKNKIIYYAEFKSNINLDTEKSKVTSIKCNYIRNNLKLLYKDYNIKSCLVECRYTEQKEVPNDMKNKYTLLNKEVKLCSINTYLQELSIDLLFTQENYKEFLNTICDKMFNNSL